MQVKHESYQHSFTQLDFTAYTPQCVHAVKDEVGFIMKGKRNQRDPEEPIWDANDPDGSFRRYAESLHRKARQMFMQDKTHAEMVFVFEVSGKCLLLLVRGDRDEFIANLRRLIKERPVVGVVHIAETWMRVGGRGDHVTKQIVMGEMGVSDLRPEDREEALLVSIQSRDAQGISWVHPILRDAKAGKVSLGEGFTINEIGGRFGRLFK